MNMINLKLPAKFPTREYVGRPLNKENNYYIEKNPISFDYYNFTGFAHTLYR